MGTLLAVFWQFNQRGFDEGFIEETSTGPNWLMIIFGAIVAVVVIGLLISSIEIVSEKQAVVIERLGKFHTIFGPGLHFRVPLIDQAVEQLSLQIQQMEAHVKVKTRDNVFVTLPVTVQSRVQEEKVREAYYEIDEPAEAIQALVLNEVKTTAADMELEDVFASRDHIQDAVKTTLGAELGKYGYEIINVVVDNPTLSPELEASYNSVMAAQRKQDAAKGEAEATRIRMEGEANAEAASLRIKGEAIVHFRTTIADGNADAIIRMTAGTDLRGDAVLRYFEITDINDAIRDAAAKGATIVVATPNAQDGLYAALKNGNAPRTTVA